MFTHCHDHREKFIEMKRLYEDEVRYYKVDEETNLSYPSITSILSFNNRDKFADWRQRVGNEEANRITKHSTDRGTKFHKVCEGYLQNGDYESLDEYQVPLVQLMFKAAKPHIDKRINNIHLQEAGMHSTKLCLAGTVDLIAEMDGELAVIAFKTAKEEKPIEWLEDYFVQLFAYWAMFTEHTQVLPRKLVVFLVGENGDVQIEVSKPLPIHYDTLKDYVSKFIRSRDA